MTKETTTTENQSKTDTTTLKEAETYLLSYIAGQDSSDNAAKTHQELVKMLEDHSAHVTQSRMPVLRKLAYPIKKQKGGFMGSIEFWADPLNVPLLQKTMQSTENVLRGMITKKEHYTERRTTRTPRPSKETYSSPETEKERINKEKMSIEEIDKKLDEIMSNIGNS